MKIPPPERRERRGSAHPSDSVPGSFHNETVPNVKHPSPLIGRAKCNRRQMNEGEVRIWTGLRRKAIGVRFRRQHPIGPYIVDFACLTLKLVIEIDGSQHYDSVMADSLRDHT